MFRQVLALSVLALSVATAATSARAEEMIEVTPNDEIESMRVVVTSDVVEGILASGQYESEELTEEEAQERAAEAGVTLTSANGTQTWSHPWVVIKAGIGVPNLVSAAVEVFVHKNWTVELGAGVGLLPTVFEASVRWRPSATCWGCDGKNMLSLGFGIDPGVYINDNKNVGIMLTASVDLMYIHRFAEHFGIFVGTRLGVGAVTETQGTSWTGLEPTFKINLIQVGFAF